MTSCIRKNLGYLKIKKKCIAFSNMRLLLTFRKIVLGEEQMKKHFENLVGYEKLEALVYLSLSRSLRLEIRRWDNIIKGRCFLNREA